MILSCGVIFWSMIFIALIVAIYFTGANIEGFDGLTFIPAWRRRWGGGPPPWRGWRNPWGWGWPLRGWGRYGWGSSWGYDPRQYYVTYMEPFVGAPVEDTKGEGIEAAHGNPGDVDKVYEFPPNSPAQVIKSIAEPYQLLNDEFPSVGPPENISKLTAEGCFNKNFERLLEPTGNYRQMTNNFKHGYPDSCSAPFHELVTSFYKSDGMKINVPANCVQ